MLDKNLLKEIHSLYKAAHSPLYPHKRIFRGESRSISSAVEDLFAKYLIELLPSDITLYINQTITAGSLNTRIRVKPDIVVVRDEIIKAIIDLKMDLGYKRKEFPAFWDERDKLIPRMRGKQFSLFKTNANEKTKRSLEFSNNAKLYFVVISDQNITHKHLSVIKKRLGKKKYSETYFLLEGAHPNDIKTSPELLNKNLSNFSKVLNNFVNDLKKMI